MESKHIFAFYKKDLSRLVEGVATHDMLEYKDATLWNRLVKIVRLQPGDFFILFDATRNITLKAADTLITNKRTIAGIVQTIEKNRPLTPHITLFLPLLKKEAFEYALYVATQMGVTSVVPVITEKSVSTLLCSPHRLESIMIAACEQSKNFVTPTLKNPITFSQWMKSKGESLRTSQAITDSKKPTNMLWFNEYGKPVTQLLRTLEQQIKHNDCAIAITLGPEGGFTEQEETLLRACGYDAYKLTPTVLRSREAICVAVGIVRSL